MKLYGDLNIQSNDGFVQVETVGGDLTIRTANEGDGDIEIFTGDVTGSDTGNITIYTGDVIGTGHGGNITIQGGDGSGAEAGSVGGDINIIAGDSTSVGGGGDIQIVTGQGGASGTLELTASNALGAGNGGSIEINTGDGGSSTGQAGDAGTMSVTIGSGGAATSTNDNSYGGPGGGITITLGNGGAASITDTDPTVGSPFTGTGGAGGSFSVVAGAGGSATVDGDSNAYGGSGGSINLIAGAGTAGTETGTGTAHDGTGGSITLAAGTGPTTNGAINLNVNGDTTSVRVNPNGYLEIFSNSGSLYGISGQIGVEGNTGGGDIEIRGGDGHGNYAGDVYIYGGYPNDTQGYQEVLIPSTPPNNGTSTTGLANDATVYTADVDINGVTNPVTVTGSAAQILNDLITEINNDLSGATAAITETGRIRITSGSFGSTSTILITDTGVFPLFSSLNSFTSIASAVSGGGDKNGSKVYIEAGESTGTGNGGDLTISSGLGFSTGNGGNVNIVAQGSSNGGVPGHIVETTEAGYWIQDAGTDASSIDSARSFQFLLRGSTSNATPLEIFRDGAGGIGRQMVIPDETVWLFNVKVVARNVDNAEHAGYVLEGLIERTGVVGNTQILGSVMKTILHEDDAAWDANCTADTTNGALQVVVTGDAADDVKWVAFARIVELTQNPGA